MAHQAADAVADRALGKDIDIIRDLPDEALVQGDAALLERALENLLSNAVKYSPAGATVTVTIKAMAAGIECHVSDTGYGIAAADIPKLFQRFQRIDDHRHRAEQGSSLGLAFVHTVVDRHGGTIAVTSQIDQGTRFIVTLPAVKR